MIGQTREPTPWATGLTLAAFVAAVTGAAIVLLSLGMNRVHPLLSAGLNLVAVGGRPSLESWGELCGSLRPALRAMRVRPSLLGWMLLAAACLLLAVSLLMGLEDLPWRA